MATPITPDHSAPLSLDELRKKRASAVDWDHLLPLATTLDISDRGPHGCLFQKPNRFALEGDEQMIALTPVQAWMFATHMVAAWFGMTVSFSALPVPGMPGQQSPQGNGPSGSASSTPPAA
jgi:hypothetical protein